MSSEGQLAELLADPMWRISNLYKIIVKGTDEGDNLVLSRSLLHRAIRNFRE